MKEYRIIKKKYFFLNYIKEHNNIKIIIIFLLIYLVNYLEFIYIKIKINNNPKISVYLPIYNKAKYLKRSIGSILKQTLKNIEIITVNDCSDDDTLKILNNMAKNDKRIKIVNNFKNKGLLYSRAMGIKKSKGEYLMNLDPDDELKSSDTLEYLYNKTMNYKVDFISFGFLTKNNLNKKSFFLRCENRDNILFQPQILKNAFNLNDYLITNKLIKREVLLKAFNFFKLNIYGKKWNYGEDEIWSTLINKYSNSMVCVNRPIFIYYINDDSLMNNKNNTLYLTNLIYWFKMFQKIFDNKNDEKYILNRIYFLIFLIKKYSFFNIIKNNKDLKNKYINIFKSIITKYNINNINLNLIKELLKLI